MKFITRNLRNISKVTDYMQWIIHICSICYKTRTYQATGVKMCFICILQLAFTTIEDCTNHYTDQ